MARQLNTCSVVCDLSYVRIEPMFFHCAAGYRVEIDVLKTFYGELRVMYLIGTSG